MLLADQHSLQTRLYCSIVPAYSEAEQLNDQIFAQEASADFQQRQFEGTQPLFSQPKAGDGNRPIVVACAVSSLQPQVQVASGQSGAQIQQQYGYGYGAPGSMYPGSGEAGTID